MTAKRRERRGEGSVHQRPNGSWCGQVTLNPDTDGRRRRKTIYAPTEADLRQKMKALRRQLDDAGDLATSDPRLETWLADWLERVARPRLKPNGYRCYRSAITHHVNPSIGKVYLSRLSVAHVRRMHADVSGRLSIHTTQRAHAALSAALDDAVKEGRVTRNVAKVTGWPKGEAEKERVGLSTSSARSLLRASPDSRWHLALKLGLRQGERLGLRWDHVDLNDGLADLSWSLSRVAWEHGCAPKCERSARSCADRHLPIPKGVRHEVLEANFVLLTPKTKKSRRIVPLLPDVLTVLRDQHAVTGTSKHGLVWCNPDGSPLDPKRDWKDWKAALEAAGIPPVTLHEARHTTATLLMEDGVDVKVIGAILGHSSAVTTQGYQHASLELARQALAGISERLAVEA